MKTKKLIISLLLFLSPIIFLLGIYIVKDPFKVLYHYDCYYERNDTPNIVFELIGLDRDFISSQSFINNYHRYHYDSYIFGSSRSKVFLIKDWGKYIIDTGFFHWDASGESLYGIEKKLLYINNHHYNIKNAIIVLDPYTFTKVTNDPDRIGIKHYAISGQNVFDFHGVFLREYFDPEFLKAYLYHLFTGNIKQYMIDKSIFNNNKVHLSYDTKTNELQYYTYEQQIETDRDEFYKTRNKYFIRHDTVEYYAHRVIFKIQEEMINNIKKVLENNHTNYKIIISPSYDLLKMDSIDIAYLRTMFGKKNVYDFSGKNQITINKYNYYEDVHYRPCVAERILRIIYSPDPDDSIRSLHR